MTLKAVMRYCGYTVRRPRLLLITNRKWHIGFQINDIKIIRRLMMLKVADNQCGRLSTVFCVKLLAECCIVLCFLQYEATPDFTSAMFTKT